METTANIHQVPSVPGAGSGYDSSSFSPSLSPALPTTKESTSDTSERKQKSCFYGDPATCRQPSNMASPDFTTESESEEE